MDILFRLDEQKFEDGLGKYQYFNLSLGDFVCNGRYYFELETPPDAVIFITTSTKVKLAMIEFEKIMPIKKTGEQIKKYLEDSYREFDRKVVENPPMLIELFKKQVLDLLKMKG